MPKMSSIDGLGRRGGPGLPAVVARQQRPVAGTTALTVVDVVPAARQEVTVAHAALCSSPVSAGTLAAVHVRPPSLLIAMAPCPCPAVVAVNPVTRQAAAGDAGERSRDLAGPPGDCPPVATARPKSVDWADQNVVPSVGDGGAVDGAGAVDTGDDDGAGGDGEACVQMAPPSCGGEHDARRRPKPPRPTAMQSRVVGHEIPVEGGRRVRGPAAEPTQVRPPLTVASTR